VRIIDEIQWDMKRCEIRNNAETMFPDFYYYTSGEKMEKKNTIKGIDSLSRLYYGGVAEKS
jgi:hypothetical protein